MVFHAPSDESQYSTQTAWDDSYSSSSSYLSSSSPLHSPGTTALMERLSQDSVAILARLAAAFSPPQQPFQLKDIETVHVLGLTDQGIEIVASLCENDGCVTLTIPVVFPESCPTSEDEICILQNLDQLDVTALQLLEQQNLLNNNNNGETQGERQMRQEMDRELQNSQVQDLPGWWMNPLVPQMETECNSLKKLLNEDEFTKDVRELLDRSFHLQEKQHYDIHVDQVAVALVGPAGVVIRARVKPIKDSFRTEIIETAIPFGQTAQDVDQLQSLLLGLIENHHNNNNNNNNIHPETQDRNNHGVQYPAGWIHADATNIDPKGLQDECVTLQTLLNEDEFLQERKALVLEAMRQANHNDQSGVVQDATVVAVGPAGLLVQARSTLEAPVQAYPIWFGAVAHDVNTLRNQVLKMMDDMQQKTQQQHNTASAAAGFSYPHWWVDPSLHSSPEIQQECLALIRMLNEPEYATEIVAMVSVPMRAAGKDTQFAIQQAQVVDVGPTGVIVCATLVERNQQQLESSLSSWSTATAPATTTTQTVHVPIPFTTQAMDSVSLRAAMIGLVRQAAETTAEEGSYNNHPY